MRRLIRRLSLFSPVIIMAEFAGSSSICSSLKEGKPTKDELEKLGVDIGEKWMTLGRRLRVSDPKLEEIHHNRDLQMPEKAYYMLKHWLQKNGSDATYQALCDGLLDELVERKDLAEKFCYINVSQKIEKGSCIRKKRKASSSSYGYRDNLKKAALDQGKNKSEEEQEGSYNTVYGDSVKDTSTVNEDNNYINVPYIHNDSELQQSRKPMRIRSYSLKRQNKEKKVYFVVVIKNTKYENVMEYKFDFSNIDCDHVLKIIGIKDISDYSLVIVIGKSNISTSPVDIQIGEKEFKKFEAEIQDGNSSVTITIWGDQTSPVDIQIGKKELLTKLEAEIYYNITITFREDQVKTFKNQLTDIINIQGTKCLSLNSDSKIVQIANEGESLFQDNSSSATVEVISISCVGEPNRIFQCKKCGEKLMPCQGNLQQCTMPNEATQ